MVALILLFLLSKAKPRQCYALASGSCNYATGAIINVIIIIMGIISIFIISKKFRLSKHMI